ncbi:HAD hydrolase family protein [Paenibacillus vulneris]|uniref:N-acylneuraminate cytidylyltransferase n=1 Tax=Paenibacillus vulneris TaxID=1133364 RepID=A0ABW3UFE2_9BACL
MKGFSVRNLRENQTDDNKFVAFIPVRGGSKSIPLKNIKLFNGKPLVYWAIYAAVNCRYIDKVYVSTDSEEIRMAVQQFAFKNVNVIRRSDETASDVATTESAMMEFAYNHLFSNIILIQATSPLVESQDLDEAINQYIHSDCDSLLSVVRQKRFIWSEASPVVGAIPINYNPMERPRRQENKGFLVENGCFYITSRSKLLSTGCRISGKITLYEMKEETYFEIDEEADWLIAEQLKKKLTQSQEKLDFNGVNLFISDVDGVLTDSGMYYSEIGDELKKFNTKDGKGIELLRNAGISVMFLTSENISIVQNRATKLKIDFVFMGIKDKKKFLDDFFSQHKEYSYDKTIYIGDDINDLDCMKHVFYSFTPSDGHNTIKQSASYICERPGGQGCVREAADIILSRRSYG